jgi:hypothetical protein
MPIKEPIQSAQSEPLEALERRISERIDRITRHIPQEFTTVYEKIAHIEDMHERNQAWLLGLLDKYGVQIDTFDIERTMINERIDRIERRLKMR